MAYPSVEASALRGQVYRTLHEPPLRRARVSLEPFRAPQPDGVVYERARGHRGVDAEPRADAQERVDGQPAGIAGRAARRRAMVRTSAAFAEHCRPPRAYPH